MSLTHTWLPTSGPFKPGCWLALGLSIGFALLGGWVAAPAEADEPTSRTYGVQVIRNLSYYDGEGADDTLHRLDLYLPRGCRDFPVLVFVHGGAWSRGDKNELGIYNALGRCFARQGIGLVCPNYRLSPGVKHPEHVRDIARAFAWTFRNIARYGGRPEELFIGGHSAGGHLAALLAADETYLKGVGLTLGNVRGALPMSGLFALPGPQSPNGKGSETWLFNKATITADPAYALFSAVFGDDPRMRELASPIAHVRDNLPPFLIMCADTDLPFCGRPWAEAFCNALRARQCAAEFLEMQKRNHVSILWNATYETDPSTQAMMSFILAQVVLDRLGGTDGASAIDFLQQAIVRYGKSGR
jgi:acetyl esterase/lipase